jgi:CHASE3 domain sensor protein
MERAFSSGALALPAPGRQAAWHGPTQGEVAVPERSGWSLAQRMTLMLTCLVAVVVVNVAIVTVTQAAIAGAHERAMAAKQTSSDVALLQLQMQKQEEGLLNYATTRDQIYLNDLATSRASGAKILAKLKRDALDSQEQTYVTQLEGGSANWQSWADKRRQAIAASKPGTGADQVDADTGALLMESFNRSAIVFQGYADGKARNATDLANQQTAFVGRVVLATGVVSLLIVVLLAIAVFRQTLRPIRDLVGAATDLANGRSVNVPWTARSDEVGQLAKGLAAWNRASQERMALARTMTETSATADVNQLLRMCTARLQEELAAAQVVAVLGLGSQWRVMASTPQPYCAGVLIPRSPEADALRAGQMLAGDLRTLDTDPALRSWVVTNDLGPVLSMPLVSGGQLLGVVSAVRRINQPAFSALDQELADIIVPSLSAAIHVALLSGQLRDLSARRQAQTAAGA